MSSLLQRIEEALLARQEKGILRSLSLSSGLIDFSSNDYLGFARDPELHERILRQAADLTLNGSGGSRLLTGNSDYAEKLEARIANYHYVESALFFGSGYAANSGLISTLARPGDTIVFDELIHASLREGIKLSAARSIPFLHNNMSDLANKLNGLKGQVFVIAESVYSMDGDSPDLREMVKIVKNSGAELIIDEAHAMGISGERGEGMLCQLGLQNEVFAIVCTYGKAMGVQGAAILGTNQLKSYLINFCKAFIYTTAPSFLQMIAVNCAYDKLSCIDDRMLKISVLRDLFNNKLQSIIRSKMPCSVAAILAIIMPKTGSARLFSERLGSCGYDVRPIVYPTVPQGSERLRINLHAFNSESEVAGLAEVINSIWDDLFRS